MGRMPRWVSRRCIHSGEVAVGSRPRSSQAPKRPHRSGSRISTPRASAAGAPPVGGSAVGRAKGTPSRAARSRARPATLRASGRLALTSRSQSTSGSRPRASAIGVPGVRSGGRMRMPAWSEPRPSSADEHSIPLDHSPRILRRAISMPSGMVEPRVASGTRSPTSMLKAPQQICRASPSPASTSTRPMRSALGWGRRSSTRATTMPSRPSPRRVTSSTGVPRSLKASLRTSASWSNGARSRSQDWSTFIRTAPGSGRRPTGSRAGRGRRGGPGPGGRCRSRRRSR